MRIVFSLMVHTLTFLIIKGDLIMGKAGVPHAVVCKNTLMQAETPTLPALLSTS